MDKMDLLPNHRAFLDRFIQAYRDDDRITAVFLGGSYSVHAADEHSDLDLFVVVTDDDYDNVLGEQVAFLNSLGEPVFMESFGLPDFSFFIYSDGTEGHVKYGRESHFKDIHWGPYDVLLDKKNILKGVVFMGNRPDLEEQTENLRRMIYYFWHDVSHLITAAARGQLWWAQGQLECIRGICVSLVRLQNNFFDEDAESEAYFKVERAIPVQLLSALEETYGPIEKDRLIRSAFIIVDFYKKVAVPLAKSHGIAYPEVLERIMVDRLTKLRNG